MTAPLAALFKNLARLTVRRSSRYAASDISPGWQERAARLRQTIRNCQHKRELLRNESGVLFCAMCGRHLDDDSQRKDTPS
jgi:hypothetical protein